jgi:hypothetical protein
MISYPDGLLRVKSDMRLSHADGSQSCGGITAVERIIELELYLWVAISIGAVKERAKLSPSGLISHHEIGCTLTPMRELLQV